MEIPMGLGRIMVRMLFFAIISFSILVHGQQGADPNNAQGANVPPPQQQQEEELPSIEVKSIQAYLAPFYYDETNYRNPFLHPELAIPLVPGEVYGPFLPLQSFKLHQLSVNGLFWNTAKPKAIIATPKGKTIAVGIKDYVGENFGYIASIREKEIVVIQTLEEQGQRYTTTKVLFLSKGKGREQ